MALTKETKDDYEIRGEFKTIQKRTRTINNGRWCRNLIQVS